jgi:L-fuculose-phosphate aldolase
MVRESALPRAGSRENANMKSVSHLMLPSCPVEDAEARDQVAAASRRLAQEGLVLGTAGNVSARIGDRVAISPTGAQLAQLEAEQVTIVDLAGDVVDGDLAPTSELDLHLGVYRREDGIGAVVHTHAPMATALSCVIDELPCVHYGMLAFGGAVRVAPYRTFGSPELADAVLAALNGRTVALMQNHGAIACAATPAAAVDLSLQLEWACSVYWHAAQLGKPRVLSPDELEAVVRTVVERGYGSTHALDKEAER